MSAIEAVNGWVLRAPRLVGGDGCRADSAPAARGLRHSRAHQHERVRQRPGDFDARWADSEPLRARPLARRLEWRQWSRDGCRFRGFRVGDRHGRIYPGTRVHQRDRWSPTDLWADRSRRDHPTGAVVGYRRPHGRPRRSRGLWRSRSCSNNRPFIDTGAVAHYRTLDRGPALSRLAVSWCPCPHGRPPLANPSWSLWHDYATWSCELRCHGESYGWEAQIDLRRLAEQWAEEERKVLEQGGA